MALTDSRYDSDRMCTSAWSITARATSSLNSVPGSNGVGGSDARGTSWAVAAVSALRRACSAPTRSLSSCPSAASRNLTSPSPRAWKAESVAVRIACAAWRSLFSRASKPRVASTMRTAVIVERNRRLHLPRRWIQSSRNGQSRQQRTPLTTARLAIIQALRQLAIDLIQQILAALLGPAAISIQLAQRRLSLPNARNPLSCGTRDFGTPSRPTTILH